MLFMRKQTNVHLLYICTVKNVHLFINYFLVLNVRPLHETVRFQTDTVGYESFSMETASSDVIDHPHYRVTLEQGARLVPGKVGNAVSLQGQGDYVDLGEHMDKCLANLDVCGQGITMTMLLNPKSLKTNQYFLSSPTYSLYLQNGQLKADFYSSGKHWNVSTRGFHLNEWNGVMLSWNKETGLEMYLNDKIVDKNEIPTDMTDMMQDDARATGGLYIGKSSDSSIEGTAEMMADEVQYWYADLSKMKARGLYQGKITHKMGRAYIFHQL